jgi:hypothetical protein
VSDLGRGLFSFEFPAQIETSASRERPHIVGFEILHKVADYMVPVKIPKCKYAATILAKIIVDSARGNRRTEIYKFPFPRSMLKAYKLVR